MKLSSSNGRFPIIIGANLSVNGRKIHFLDIKLGDKCSNFLFAMIVLLASLLLHLQVVLLLENMNMFYLLTLFKLD